MSDEETVPALSPGADAIELRHLRAFVVVADELNFSRAALRLFISQPALSRQIRGLERAIGCDLFRRSTQRVELTVAGEALLAKTRPLLADLAEAISATRSVGGELAARMSRLYQPWVDASGDIAGLDEIRAAVEELHARFAPPEGLTVAPIVAGGVPALRMTPAVDTGRTILFLHGGGHIGGSAFGYRHLAGSIATAAGASVLIVDYRLAPEHPFPASLDDALAAYDWLLGTGADTGKITVAGDSSGGGLVMSLLLALRERGAPLPAGVALLCPWVDLSGRTQRPPQESPILFVKEMAQLFAKAYLAGHPEDDPLVDPLHADLSGLPPLLVHAASGDSVLQEAQLLARHAKACGVPVTMTIYPVPTHDFHVFWRLLPEAAAAVDEAGRFLRDVAGDAAAEVS